MKIACPKCGREYRLDPARIPAKGARFTCWGCQAKVEVRPVQTGDLKSQATVEMTKPLLPEQLQSAVKSPAAVAAASSAPSSKGASSEQRSGMTSAFEEDLDSDNFITGPGLQVVKNILSPGKSGSSDVQQQEEQKKEPIKITCPKCSHEYRLDPGRIPIGGGKFTCRNCQARIEVRPVVKQDRAAITSALPSAPVVTISERSVTAELSGEDAMAFTSPALAGETSKTVELPTISDLALPVTGDMPTLSSLSAPAIFEEPSQPKAAPSTLSMQSPFNLDMKLEAADIEAADITDATESTMSMKSPFVPVSVEKEPMAVEQLGFEVEDKRKTETAPLKSEEADSSWKLDEPTEPSFDLPKQVTPEVAPPKEAAPTTELSAFEVAALAAEMAGLKSETLAALKSETKEEKPEPESKPLDFSFKFDEAEAPKLELPKQSEEPKEEAKTPPPPVPPAPAFDPFATVPIAAVKKPEMASIVEQSIEEKQDSIFGSGPAEDILKTVTSMPAPPKPSVPPPVSVDNKESTQKSSQENADTLISQFATDSSFKDLFVKEVKPAEPPKPLPPPIKPPPPPQPPPPQPLRTQPPPPVQSLPKPESKPAPAPAPEPAFDIKPDPKIVSEEPAPIRFVYHADQDAAHHEEPVPEEPKRSIVSRVAVIVILGAALGAVAAVVYFFFLKPSAPPPDQQAQNIPSKPAPSTGTGTTEPSPTPGQSTSPGQPAKPEPAKPEPAQTQPAKPEPTKPSQTLKPEPAKPEPTKPVKPEPAKPVSTAPSGNGKYTVQVAAASTEAEAKKIGDRFQAAGFQSYIVRADLGDKGVWYRVRMGRYGSTAEASKAAARVKAKGFNCFIGLYQ